MWCSTYILITIARSLYHVFCGCKIRFSIFAMTQLQIVQISILINFLIGCLFQTDADVIKLFFILWTNKLECLPVACIFSLTRIRPEHTHVEHPISLKFWLMSLSTNIRRVWNSFFNKHSSLLVHSVSEEEKRFYNTGPGFNDVFILYQCNKTFFFVTDDPVK